MRISLQRLLHDQRQPVEHALVLGNALGLSLPASNMTSTPSSALASVLVVVEAALHNLDTFRRGEIRVMAENGIDTSEIHWLEWEVTGYEEARWTIEAPEATIQTILNAGWQQATV